MSLRNNVDSKPIPLEDNKYVVWLRFIYLSLGELDRGTLESIFTLSNLTKLSVLILMRSGENIFQVQSPTGVVHVGGVREMPETRYHCCSPLICQWSRRTSFCCPPESVLWLGPEPQGWEVPGWRDDPRYAGWWGRWQSCQEQCKRKNVASSDLLVVGTPRYDHIGKFLHKEFRIKL